MEASPLQITVRQLGPVSIVAVCGEVDVSNSERLLTSLRALAADGDVVVDAHDMTFIDARGIDALLAAAEVANRRGHRVRVVSAGTMLQRLLALVEAEQMLEVEHGAAECDALERRTPA